MLTQAQNSLNASFIVIGSLIIILLVGFIFLFVILYQRRMLQHQQEMLIAEAEKQQSVLKALFKGQETERERLAKDLHDSIGASLSAVKNNLSHIEQKFSPALSSEYLHLLNKTKLMTDDTIAEIRQLMNNLMPTVLIDFGLPTALSSLCQRTQTYWEINVLFECPDKNLELKQEYSLSLYRITQELFNNAIKYSQAKNIIVSFMKRENTIIFSFRDDGVGFDKEKVEKQVGSGYGLQNIESRAGLLPAFYQMKTAPGKGTTVEIVFL